METVQRTVKVEITDKAETTTWDADDPDLARAFGDLVELADEGQKTGRVDLDNSDPQNPTIRMHFED